MKRMNVRQWMAAAALWLVAGSTLMAQAAFDVPYVPQDALTCIVANDLGRNGYY